MATTSGLLTILINSKEYRLWLCHLGIEALQEKFGDDFLKQISPPTDLDAAELLGWMPPLKITNAIVRESLKRYHSKELEEDPYIVGDAIAQNEGLFMNVLDSSFPNQEQEPAKAGNVKAARKKAT